MWDVDYKEYVSKFEITILALLWCQGSQEDKARALLNIIGTTLTEDGEEEVELMTNELLQLAFKKLLYFSNDLPRKQELCSADLSNSKEFQDMKLKEEMYSDLFIDWLIMSAFPTMPTECNKNDFIATIGMRLGPGTDLGWLFDPRKLRTRLRNIKA